MMMVMMVMMMMVQRSGNSGDWLDGELRHWRRDGDDRNQNREQWFFSTIISFVNLWFKRLYSIHLKFIWCRYSVTSMLKYGKLTVCIPIILEVDIFVNYFIPENFHFCRQMWRRDSFMHFPSNVQSATSSRTKNEVFKQQKNGTKMILLGPGHSFHWHPNCCGKDVSRSRWWCGVGPCCSAIQLRGESHHTPRGINVAVFVFSLSLYSCHLLFMRWIIWHFSGLSTKIVWYSL